MRAVCTCARAADTCAAVDRSSASESSSCMRDTRFCFDELAIAIGGDLGVGGRGFGLFESWRWPAASAAR